MIRAISIVLILAIVLQTVGCSTWRPLVRMNDVPEDERQTYMGEQVLGKLNEGMAVRITIRDGTPAPFKRQVIECIIEEIGQTSLTLIPITDHVRGTVKREFRLDYTDIESIEDRESEVALPTHEVAVVVAITVFLVLRLSLSGMTFD